MNANCFLTIAGPVKKIKGGISKTGKPYCFVNLCTTSYNSTKRDNPYETQFFSCCAFGDTATKIQENVKEGDWIIAVCGNLKCGKAFNTNKGDSIQPIECFLNSWKLCATPPATPKAEEKDDEGGLPWE